MKSSHICVLKCNNLEEEFCNIIELNNSKIDIDFYHILKDFQYQLGEYEMNTDRFVYYFNKLVPNLKKYSEFEPEIKQCLEYFDGM